MEKKKAIKIATATAIAATAITGVVAPAQTEAASSLDKQITKAKSTMKKPYDRYIKSTSKLAAVNTVKKDITAAKKAQKDANAAIKASKLSAKQKAAKYAQIKSYAKYITRAEGYVKGYEQATAARAELAKLTAKLDTTEQIAAAEKAIKAAKKEIKDTVYGAKIETLLYNKFTKSAETAVAAAKKALATPVAIESVSALNDANSYLTIKFNTKVTKLEAADIEIKNAKSGELYGVKSVTLSTDGKSATAELFSPDNASKTNPVLAYTTDYTVTVKANGKVTTSTFNRSEFVEARVTDVDVDGKEFTVVEDDNDNKHVIKVFGDAKFDYDAALGQLVRVWYNDKNELVKYEIVGQPDTSYQAIEITDTDEIKILSTGKKVDISDLQYKDNSDAKFKFYINGVDVTDYQSSNDIAKIPASLANKAGGQKFNFAKIGYDKSGDVEYIAAYTLNDFLIVDHVEGDEIVGVTGSGTGGSFNAKDATVVKDGKAIALTDVKQGDVLFFDTKADGGDGFAAVYNKTVTGKIDTVYYDKIAVGGKNYTFARSGATVTEFSLSAGDVSTATVDSVTYAHDKAVYINEDGETEIIADADKAEELQAGGEVTLYLDPAGNLVYVKGATSAVAQNKVSGVLTDSINLDNAYNTPKAQLEVKLENGKEELTNLNLENLKQIVIDGQKYDIDDTPDATEFAPSIVDGADADALANDAIKLTSGGSASPVTIDTANFPAGTLVQVHLDSNGNIDKLYFYTSSSTIEGKGTSTSVVEPGDKYMGGKKLLANTAVYDLTDGTDPEDVTITTWDKYKGSDIQNATYIYNDKNEVIAFAINATTTSDATYETAVVTGTTKNKDAEIVEVKAYVNGSIETYQVDKETSSISKGDVVVLEFDDNNPTLVNEIYKGASTFVVDADGDTVKDAGDLQVSDFVAPSLTVAPGGVDVGNRTVTFTNGDTYKLTNTGKVLDGSDVDDITIEALSDLTAAGIKVTVALDEENTKFAKYFVFSPDSNYASVIASYNANNDATTKVEAAEAAVATAVASKTKANLDAAQAALTTAQTAVTALTDATTKAALQTRINTAKASGATAADTVFVATKGADASHIKLTFGGTDLTDFSTGYTVTKSGEANGDTVSVTASTGTVAGTFDDSTAGSDETSTVTVTVTNSFWNVADTVTVTAVDGDGVTPNSITVNAD